MTAFTELSSAWRARRRGLKREKMGALARREARWGLLFLSPWIIGFLVFYLIPMGASLVFSFTSFNLEHPDKTQFIGLVNYARLFNDPQVRKSLLITTRFMLMAAPIGVAWPLFLAVLLNARSLRAKQVFRTLYFLPNIVPIVSVAYIWHGFLNAQTGWLNQALGLMGISGPGWLTDPDWIYPALLLVGLWGVGDPLLRTLAGMQSVPTEYYEAARVDGANALHTFRHITIPMVSPMIFYNLVLLVIGLFQYFLLAWILGGPQSNPAEATLFYNVYLYKQAFSFSNMGYGATLAWVLFFLAMTVTVVLFGTQKYWVYYAAAEED
jgi:multiple sugar transport system permease protein